jgi:ERCC4-type nuclease
MGCSQYHIHEGENGIPGEKYPQDAEKRTKYLASPVLIQDSREQLGYGPLFSGPYVVQALPAGDYSVCGLENRIAIERKSLPDLLSSLTHGRERFERELAKAKSYDVFLVVVECSPSDILERRYDADVHPAAAWESVCTFAVRHCPILFGESREYSARLVESLLRKYAREFFRTAEEIAKASEQFRRAGDGQ